MIIGLRKLSHVAALAAVACDGKLMVDRGNAPAGSGGGAAGSADSGSGGLVIPPEAGKLGHPCIPGGIVTESEGITTEVETLTRCDSGLACNAKGECVAAPDCQTSDGVCVVQPPVLDPAGNNAIVALAADDSNVYWLENLRYQGSEVDSTSPIVGQLLSYSITDHKTTTLALLPDDPAQLAVTTSHAYLSMSSSDSDNGHTRLLRVPLGGGGLQPIQQWDFSRLELSFVAVGSQAFWSDGVIVSSMRSAPDASPTLLAPGDNDEASPMVLAASDGADLFYWSVGDNWLLMRTSIGNFAPEAVGIEHPPGRGFALSGDDFFALTRAVPNMDPILGRGIMLSRVPKSGGDFEAIRSLGDGVPYSLQTLGDRYFFQVSVNTGQKDSAGSNIVDLRVLMASFNDNAPPIRLLERRTDAAWRQVQWVATAHDLFWTDGKTLYRQPLPAR